MKKLIAIIALASLFASILLLTGCNGLSKNDQQCIDDIEQAVQDYFDTTKASHNTVQEKWGNIETGISTQLNSLEKYATASFDNKELESIVGEYLSALKSQKEGVSYIFTDPTLANSLYYENGQDKARECLAKLNSNYGLAVDKNHETVLKSFIEGKKNRIIGVGETITASGKQGEINISFNSYVQDPYYHEGYSAEHNGFLLCKVTNTSAPTRTYEYSNGDTIEMASLDGYFKVYDGTGTTISFSSYGNEVMGYEACPGMLAEIQQGETKRLAFECQYCEPGKMIETSASDGEYAYHCFLVVE